MTTPKVDEFFELYDKLMADSLYQHQLQLQLAGFKDMTNLACKLERDNIALLQALRKYGRHHYNCTINYSGACNCGLSNVLYGTGTSDIGSISTC